MYLLKKHMAIHSEVKTYQCDICGKQFRESSTLKLHSRIHTGAMPYCCEFCERNFRFHGVYVVSICEMCLFMFSSGFAFLTKNILG